MNEFAPCELAEELRIGAVNATVLLVVDQAEDILGPDARKEAEDLLRLLDSALDVPDGTLMAVCTLRSDLLGALQQQPAVDNLHFEDLRLTPMSKAGMIQVVEGRRIGPGSTWSVVCRTS